MYVLDTYALIEIINENPKFQKYKSFFPNKIFIASTTFAEFYVIINERSKDKNELMQITNPFRQFIKEINTDIFIEAILFRKNHNKQTKGNMSFFDSVGYIFALKNNYLFLTGDKEFKSLPNVEFIEK